MPRRRVSRSDPAVVDLVRRLGATLSDLGLSELDVAWGDVRIRLQRAPATPVKAVAEPTGSVVRQEAPVVVDAASSSLVAIEAPMVGTFYRSPSPGAEPYVHEGDVVKPGQILCIIEAMKLMNEIEAKVAGRIVRILVENGQGVEYGQPLFQIDPAG